MPDDKQPRAVALRYDESLPAPIVVARGTGRMAERIGDLALESGVPIVRDEALCAGLQPIDVGEYVPREYWELVARVLVFIRNVRR
ncbi:MAG: EscU/YscU/HrcU family type III secretion system export apparatus switch protein [Spirochaetales bacterium]|nr:EscU/YscU/HrcU family type III secretion system export apparatus switch protein [Spirochaetales bacterium]